MSEDVFPLTDDEDESLRALVYKVRRLAEQGKCFRLAGVDGLEGELLTPEAVLSAVMDGREVEEADRQMPERMFAVLKAMRWSSVEVDGVPLPCGGGGPQRFMPIFYTRVEAEAWNGGPDCIEEIQALP